MKKLELKCICGTPEGKKKKCPLSGEDTHCQVCGLKKSMYLTEDKNKKKICGNRNCSNFKK